jgi:hypothetical protein
VPTNQTPQLLDQETAYATIYQQVYSPTFFQKLAADYNIRPNNEKEAMDMLTMAAKLRMAHDHQQQKRAAARNPLNALHSHLDQQLSNMGLLQQDTVPQTKRAALAGAKNPELAHAILSMQVAAHVAAQ